MVFQSERRPDNPFYQMYLLDFTTGDIENVSPGYGKTTCGWIHPDNNRVLLASTHEDPAGSGETEKAELEFRESGQSRNDTVGTTTKIMNSTHMIERPRLIHV